MNRPSAWVVFPAPPTGAFSRPSLSLLPPSFPPGLSSSLSPPPVRSREVTREKVGETEREKEQSRSLPPSYGEEEREKRVEHHDFSIVLRRGRKGEEVHSPNPVYLFYL